MFFKHISRSTSLKLSGKHEMYLVDSDWDDYGFRTTFEAIVFDENGRRTDLGSIKILRRSLQRGRVSLPGAEFDQLDADYCSLGQKQDFYETLMRLSVQLRRRILTGLRDCAYQTNILSSFLNEKGMQSSLLRFLDVRTVREVFHNILTGSETARSFRFQYHFPTTDESSGILDFDVVPKSVPPTNIHSIIGPNGVGKTRLLWNIARILCKKREEVLDAEAGQINFIGVEINLNTEEVFGNGARFLNLITVAFSAFDPFDPLRIGSTADVDIQYSYIGLKKAREWGHEPEQYTSGELKTRDDLEAEFEKSLTSCVRDSRLDRWQEAIVTLESDIIFRETDLNRLVALQLNGESEKIREAFRGLSSGHKIVLLMATRLVELVDDRTLVLFDELESHLHPPLLAAFIRFLSELLSLRNGAALIATHSPVVLQEVPKSCVWMLRRAGGNVVAERPSIETFGENVGVLTREVFGLAVTESGFHKMIADAVNDENGIYEKVLDRFDRKLGSEARAVAVALSRNR